MKSDQPVVVLFASNKDGVVLETDKGVLNPKPADAGAAEMRNKNHSNNIMQTHIHIFYNGW